MMKKFQHKILRLRIFLKNNLQLQLRFLLFKKRFLLLKRNKQIFKKRMIV